MKITFKLLVLFLGAINCYSQETIVALDHNYLYEIPNNTYVKDVNNSFLPYLGVWKTTVDDKDYFLKIVMIPHNQKTYPSGRTYYEDILVASYEVRDLSGGTLEGNLDDINLNTIKIRNVSYPVNNRLDFLYIDNDLCGLSADIVLTRNPSNPNVMTYIYSMTGPSFVDDCPYDENASVPLPLGQKTFTKVN